MPNGDLLLRSGPTPLGWTATVAQMLVVGIILGVILLAAVGIPGSECVGCLRGRRYLRALGWAFVVPVSLGLVGAFGWLVAANTVLKYQSTVVTASAELRELRSERERLVGANSVLTWPYSDIAAIEFDYVPGQPGENPIPPQGQVYVRPTADERLLIFEGAPCPARDMAESVTTASELPLVVHAGGRDVSSVGSFLTQIRCGIERPFEAADPREYPAEVWRVLDMPFLWRWPWALPIVIAQTVLVGAALVVIGRWQESDWPTSLMAAACVGAGLCIVAMHVFAAKSYGNWPGALALFALLAARLVSKRLTPESTD